MISITRRHGIRALVIIVVVVIAGYVAYKLSEDPANQMFGQTIVSGPSDERVVALTFDDGPNPPYTERILNVLAHHHVHATFFVVGRAVAAYPQTTRAIVQQGNAIGNHTWDHGHLVIMPRAVIRSEMRRTDAAIWKAAGVHTRLMRPPFGSRDWLVLDEMKKAGYTVVMWSVPLPKDWEYPSAATIAQRVVPAVKDGSIIVLHDGNRGQRCGKRLPAHVCDRSQDVGATALIVEELRRRGYRFVTIPQLIALQKFSTHKSAHGTE